MSQDLERAVESARNRLVAESYSLDSFAALRRAERELAATRGEEWAAPLDLGVQWESGAPLPHVVSDGRTTILICFSAVADPTWDGTSVRVADVDDPEQHDLLEFTFEGCHATKFGGPNDESLGGHPLFSRGLVGYEPHIVHNSSWIADEEAIDSVHPQHRGGWADRFDHYFFVFHDEMFEAIARSVTVERVRGTLRERLFEAVERIGR